MVRELAGSFVQLAVKRIDSENMGFFRKKHFYVTSVPLSTERFRYRGFNQSALLASILASELDLDYVDFLVRKRHIKPLAELRVTLSNKEKEELKRKYASRTQKEEAEKKLIKKKKILARRKATLGIFDVKDDAKAITGKNFMIVDDVWTSGATVSECGKILKRNSAGLVWGWTFARSYGL
jgi:predicted amidophosphoribosyltransferase